VKSIDGPDAVIIGIRAIQAAAAAVMIYQVWNAEILKAFACFLVILVMSIAEES
jgi:hypothetical protein